MFEVSHLFYVVLEPTLEHRRREDILLYDSIQDSAEDRNRASGDQPGTIGEALPRIDESMSQIADMDARAFHLPHFNLVFETFLISHAEHPFYRS